MKRCTLILALVAVAVLAASALYAQPLRYWGKTPGGQTGWIEMPQGQYFEVGVGTVIPGWGRVKEVGDFHLIVEQALTEHAKDQLQQQGLMAYDVLRIRIPREDLRRPHR